MVWKRTMNPMVGDGMRAGMAQGALVMVEVG
jgi:hypothetical protein